MEDRSSALESDVVLVLSVSLRSSMLVSSVSKGVGGGWLLLLFVVVLAWVVVLVGGEAW